MSTQINHPDVANAALPQNTGEEESRTILDLEGMTCASCAMRIEKGLKKVPGVRDASVNLATEKATVLYNPSITGLDQMVQKVEAVGYKATPAAAPRVSEQPVIESDGDAAPDMPVNEAARPDEQSERKVAEIRRKRNLLVLGIALTLPVVILSMFFVTDLRDLRGGLWLPLDSTATQRTARGALLWLLCPRHQG